MSANRQPIKAPDTELQPLQVRVVRLSELRGKSSQPPPPPPPEPTNTLAVPAVVASPAPVSRAAPVRQRAPAAPAAPAARTAPGTQRSLTVAPPEQGMQKKPLFSSGRVFFLLVLALLYLGWRFPTEQYITPKRGIGYALGIIGGSLMLVLLLYSLRKRYSWLGFLGPTPSWFRFHMVLGILGPLCILFHANFSTGATNSNIALFCMLIVAGSGLVGRYIYTRIHKGLYGRKLELGELRAGADGLKNLSSSVNCLPELVSRIEAAEQRLLRSGPHAAVLGFLKPLVVSLNCLTLRWQLRGYVRRSLRASARKSVVLASERRRLHAVASAYIDRRLAAGRKVAGFEGYERLFSLWHALHIPLIFMMIFAAIVHVIAVHVY